MTTTICSSLNPENLILWFCMPTDSWIIKPYSFFLLCSSSPCLLLPFIVLSIYCMVSQPQHNCRMSVALLSSTHMWKVNISSISLRLWQSDDLSIAKYPKPSSQCFQVRMNAFIPQIISQPSEIDLIHPMWYEM